MIKSILPIFIGRPARNICLWLTVIFLRLSFFDFVYSRPEITYCSLLLLILLGMLYLNNLLLVPRLLAGKKPIIYLLSVAFLIWVSSYLSASIVFDALSRHSGIAIFKIIWIPLGNKEIEDVRFLTAIHIVFFTIILFLFTLCWYAIDHQKKLRELKAIRKSQAETELAFLKNQLNPHFLFNTLNNLYGLALKKSDHTPELILKLSIILRYLLYESNVPMVPFLKEKEIIHAYIELELLRLNEIDNIDFVIYTDDNDYLVPPLLWLPVLENIFKYGIHFSALASIEFRYTIVQHTLRIYSKNNYDALNMLKHKQNHGLGLDNLKKRLSLLYPSQHRMKIIQEEDHFIVDVEIKLQ